MGTQIFLGNPPANVEQWIKDHYGPKLDEPLCFTAQEAGSTVKLTAPMGQAPEVILQTSTDGNTWTPYNIEEVITLTNVGDKVYFKAKGQNWVMAAPIPEEAGVYIYNNFEMNGKIAASGNINSLLEENEETARTMSLANRDFCYDQLFNGCRSLTTAPELPSTTLAIGCYREMFFGCGSLTTAPALPATTLANNCYESMFSECNNLNTIKLGYTGNFANAPSNAFNNWVSVVASEGTFYYNGDDRTTGPNAIPTGWTVSPWSVNGK